MQGLVLGRDSEFIGELSELVESNGNHSCRRDSDWAAIDTITSNKFDFVFCYVLDELDIGFVFQLMTQIKKSNTSLPVIVIGQHIDLESKIRLLQAGVFECFDRPVNRQRIRYLVETSGVKARSLQQRAGDSRPGNTFCDKLGPQIQKIADVDANVLITGETGVGKTFIAKQIHLLSKRRESPFVAVNCGAIPENLIESELFGHAKGTFTGADTHRIGKLAFAGNGTILLDEIDALPLAAQSTLLHVVDEHLYQPLGTNESRPVKARILAATNKSLDDLVEKGVFRSDLFYRLDVLELEIPSLRDRRDEILVFAGIFAKELARKLERNLPCFSAEVEDWMRNFDWPGNLRELRNCVEHALLCCENATIKMTDLPVRIRHCVRPDSRKSNDSIEIQATKEKRHSINGNVSGLQKKHQEIDRVICARA